MDAVLFCSLSNTAQYSVFYQGNIFCSWRNLSAREFYMSEASSAHFKPRKLLVPIDFSPSSTNALEAAAQFASVFQADLYLLHVIPMLPIVPRTGAPATFFPEQEFLHDARNDAGIGLQSMIEALSAREIKARCSVEIGNDVVGNILMVIEREHADLIVISTHGVAGWRPVVFGSIAEQVIKQVTCPLLLLRTAQTIAK
jgi:nucleotide-binding universal stress UspA family protein